MQKITIETIFKNPAEITQDIAAHIQTKHRMLVLCLIILLCGGGYGFTMGIAHSWQQAISSALKVPLLFMLTLGVCIPTLHFIGLFLGSRVSFSQSATVLLLGIAVSSVLLLGFATIAFFFWITGSQYRFLLLMHVLFFGIAGLAGLISILRNFRRLSADADTGPRTRFNLLQVWMFLYMFVGTQMAYTLSPFLGREPEFYIFHKEGGNFYTYVAQTIGQNFDGRMKPDRARDILSDPSTAVLHMLKEKDYARLAAVISPQGLHFLRNGVAYTRFDHEVDPGFSRTDLLDAAKRKTPKRNVVLRTGALPPEPSDRVSIDELLDRHIFDVDFSSVAGKGRYNKFSRGLEHKQSLYKQFPECDFAEFVVPGDAGRWDVLRLVFKTGAAGPRLLAVIRDRSD
ncbi:MAG: hypothetical protein NXI24_06270 [bacterium]|nr:hypothetical protein [bacterium]